MSLRSWFDGLFAKAYPPAAEFIKGTAAGIGVPTNLSEAAAIPKGFAKLLAGPTPEEQAEGPDQLAALLKSLPSAAAKNPPYALGFAAGTVAGGPPGPEDLSKLKPLLRSAALRRQAMGNMGDISDELHLLHEGPPGGVLENVLPTREERGAEMLQKSGIKVPPPSRAQLQAMTMEANIPALKAVPAGGTAMVEGERWLRTPRGWTKAGGKVADRDFKWILDQYFDIRTPQNDPTFGAPLPDAINANPERAVDLIKEHGGWKDLPTDQGPRSIVARHVRKRAAIGKAATEELVWLNLFDMRALGRGKIRYQ